jgi:hypothetical protein
MSKNNTAVPAANEVDSYLASTFITTDTSDILLFWKLHSSAWPRLSRIARRYLGVPATSTSSERSFSLAGCTIEDRRSQLATETVDDLMFIHGLLRLIPLS